MIQNIAVSIAFVAGFVIALIAVAAIIDQNQQIVIGHITVPREGVDDFVDPYICQHIFEKGVYLELGKPNRHRGFYCKRCGAVLWENGDITIDRGRVK